MKLLFVCSGNICRSPMAAEYTRYRSGREGLSHVVVDSAGLLGIEGSPASPEAVQVLREAGIDLSRHRSRGLTPTDLRASDLVLAMSREHVEELSRLWPGLGPSRWLLRAFEAGPEPRADPPSIDDPIGQPIDVYRECFETIRTCVDQLVLRIKHQR